MKNEFIKATIFVYNLPENIKEGYMVARYNNAELWYYGTYKTMESAEAVAAEIGNGVVLNIGNY